MAEVATRVRELGALGLSEPRHNERATGTRGQNRAVDYRLT